MINVDWLISLWCDHGLPQFALGLFLISVVAMGLIEVLLRFLSGRW